MKTTTTHKIELSSREVNDILRAHFKLKPADVVHFRVVMEENPLTPVFKGVHIVSQDAELTERDIV